MLRCCLYKITRKELFRFISFHTNLMILSSKYFFKLFINIISGNFESLISILILFVLLWWIQITLHSVFASFSALWFELKLIDKIKHLLICIWNINIRYDSNLRKWRIVPKKFRLVKVKIQPNFVFFKVILLLRCISFRFLFFSLRILFNRIHKCSNHLFNMCKLSFFCFWFSKEVRNDVIFKITFVNISSNYWLIQDWSCH